MQEAPEIKCKYCGFEVSSIQRLFPERSWGMMAESETFAHLEHLRLAGDAERFAEDGKLFYVTR